jgi:HD-GYP domain-containing protein (c-di-GMP phosphodiesterase class II)
VEESTYIRVRNSQINYYFKVPLYYQTGVNTFSLYKPAGEKITELRIKEQRHPPLFIQQQDRIAAIEEIHKGFRKYIVDNISAGNAVTVKSTLCDLVAEMLSEPRSGALQVLPETVEALVSGFSKHPETLKTFGAISLKDYTTAIHSVNVMALTLAFCFYSNFQFKQTKKYGLSALLHDVGKTEIPSSILKAERRLTPVEFKVMRSHPIIGNEIIRQKNRIGGDIALGALEHHEKLDGSGYPKGTRDVSFVGQLLGIVDCYEALTNEDRPYRRAKQPLDTLKLIKDDVDAGKFNREIFEKFCYSLI